ncbi:SpoIIE family protein phosphatase [Streptomyces sp. NPDC049040]|uniref:SpoIIE family protein phosphatase n=1 Tax=Streptomyces sp. NPDC049040 TaxID=3365593 RepID=UPI00371B29A7
MSPHSANPDRNTGHGGPQVPVATALVDASGTVVGWSAEAQRLLGYAGDDVLDGRVRALLAYDSAGTEGGRLRELIGPGAVERIEAREPWSSLLNARHLDGRAVPVALDAAPLTTAGHGALWLLSAVGLDRVSAAPAAARLLTDALLERSPVAIAFWDTGLRAVWVNDVAAQQANARPATLVDRPVDEAAGNFDLSEALPAMRRVLTTGTPVLDREIRRLSPDGEEKAFSVSMFRLEDADGAALGVCTMGIDASASTVRRRMSLLNRSGTRVGTTLDIVTTAQELADVMVPELADFATVDLSDWEPPGTSPNEPLEYNEFGNPAFRRAGMASIHPEVPEAVFDVGEVVFHPPSSPLVRPLATGQSHFEPRLDTAHSWLAEDPARERVIKRAGIHSVMVVPLKARGEILGVTFLARTGDRASFTRGDLFLAEELSVRAALSLDNARRYSRERRAALALQRDLLPRHLPDGGGLDLYSRYLPTDKQGVGGDWYDVMPLPDGRVGMVVGDVVGHGISAAASMGRLRTAVNTLADQCMPPHELLARLDHVAVRLSRNTVDPERLGIPALAATCVYAVYDGATGSCAIARAGHPPPLIITPDGHGEYSTAPAGAPIGWGLSSYESHEMTLPENTLVALFTDGLIERRGDDIDAGLARLLAAFADSRGSLGSMCSAVIDRMTRDTATEDDIALLLARTRCR